MKDSVNFSTSELSTAEQWHGGQESMLYAIVSTGALKRGSMRPHDESGRPLTDAEWLNRLAERLESEVQSCIWYARVEGDEEMRADIPALEGIARKCRLHRGAGLETDERDEFTRGYIECALWCGVLCEPELESSEDKHNESALTPAALASMTRDAHEFYAANVADLRASSITMERAGHDFWLTRNGHGTGFWDEKSLSEAADAALDRLTDAAQAYDDTSLVRGLNGKIDEL